MHSIVPVEKDGEREATRNLTVRGDSEAADTTRHVPAMAGHRANRGDIGSATTMKTSDVHVIASVSVDEGGAGRFTCSAAEMTGHATIARAAAFVVEGARTERVGVEQPLL